MWRNRSVSRSNFIINALSHCRYEKSVACGGEARNTINIQNNRGGNEERGDRNFNPAFGVY